MPAKYSTKPLYVIIPFCNPQLVQQYLGAASHFIFSVSHAKLKLPEFKYPKSTQPVSQHLSRISAFYTSHAMMLALTLVGSSHFVGNPIGLLKNISGGVAGIFVKPPWESVPDLLGRTVSGILQGSPWHWSLGSNGFAQACPT